MNQHKMDVIKEEFDDDLATPIEGWSFVTGDTKSSSQLSPSTSQSVSNQPSPPTSNHPTTSSSRSSHVNQTYPDVASVRVMPPYGRQGLVKNVETNNNRPFITARNNKFFPIGSRSQQNNTTFLFNVELQLKQTQEQLKNVTAKLVANQNAYEILETKYDQFQSNANKSIEELKLDNAKLHDKLDQLMLIVNANAQTHETSQANADIKEEYEDGETILQTSDTPNNELTDTRQVTQIVNAHVESPPNQFEEFMEQQANQLGDDASITASNHQNATKRKQSQSNRSVKRSKKTVEDGDEQEEIANEDRVGDKFKLLKLNCTEQNCQAELDSLAHLYNHLRTAHGLGPLRCFAQNCNSRFDQRRQIRAHIELHHPQSTQFLCLICHKEYDTQTKAFKHWYYIHLTGQFKCTFVSDCTEVSDTRINIETHLRSKHYSNNFACTRDGCCASFATMSRFKKHESSHLNSKPFHCNWTNCSHRSNLRHNLLRHIRNQHFGLPATMKEQMKKIVDQRDPNEFVRVVKEPIAQ